MVQGELTVLILCAGKRYPWEKDVPQQFLPIAGTTVLRRIISQVRECGHEPIIVTHRDDIRDGISDLQHFEPQGYHRCIAETWLYTQELWKGQTIILLGDVIFGKATIEWILKYRGSMRAIGNSAEIFAFTFSRANHKRLKKVLSEASEHKLWPGSAWIVYRHWCGFSKHDSNRSGRVFQWELDRCADIDSPAGYKEALDVWGK